MYAKFDDVILSAFSFVFVGGNPVPNSLQNEKIFKLSKLYGFADDRLNMAQKFEFVSDRVEYIVRRGENAGNKHFLLSRHTYVFKRLHSL